MTRSYRDALFESYNATHVAHLDVDNQSKLNFFREHTRLNYLPLLGHLNRETAEILEVACNKGYLLAALQASNFKRITGIDLSPADVEIAGHLAATAEIICIDAFDYLDANEGRFDVVVLKAVLEHVEKDKVIELLEKIESSLKPEGIAIVDVPNMDWIFGQHERYMDFTHEVGFTRESLAQVMRQVFGNVSIQKAKPAMSPGFKSRVERLLRRIVIRSMNVVFRILGEGASDTWWDCRAIVGVGRKSISDLKSQISDISSRA